MFGYKIIPHILIKRLALKIGWYSVVSPVGVPRENEKFKLSRFVAFNYKNLNKV